MTKSEKIKTVFILPALTAGGAERALITLMNGINKEIYDSSLVVVNNTGPMRKIMDESIPFYSLDSKKVSLSILKLYKQLKKLEPDIVISTMVHMNLCLMLLKPFLPKTRFIIREAITPSYIMTQHFLMAFALKMAIRFLYPKASAVMSPARIIIDEYRDDLGLKCKNHRLLYNFVDMDRIRTKEINFSELRGYRRKTTQFVAAGRLHSQKGFGRLIKALPDLNLKNDWRLTIFGEGPERHRLEKLIAKHNLTENVFLYGLSDNPWPHFAMADCFLLPSRWEGLPNVVLESLACGTPVIASHQAGGIAEIAELSPPEAVTVVNDMTDFVRAMEKVEPLEERVTKPSLLAEPFQKQGVLDKFEIILNDALKNS